MKERREKEYKTNKRKVIGRKKGRNKIRMKE